MEMSRRSAGLWGLAVAAMTVVVMVALAALEAVSWGVAAGLIAAVVFTLALLYIFFGRLNGVQKSGYAALLGVVLLALFIPLFWLNQNNMQTRAQADDYELKLHRGAALFGTYCMTCHGAQGQGWVGPQLNGSQILSKYTDDDLTRIISAGVPKSTAPDALGSQGLQMPAWSELYGGPLTADDISYLVALIRSSDPTYLKNNHISDMTNGFTYVYGELTTQAQIDLYKQRTGKPVTDFGPVVDKTNTNQVTMDIVDSKANASGYDFQYLNLKIKAGTTVTWVNVSGAPHTVVSGQPNAPDGKFDSTKEKPLLVQGNQGAASTYSFTFNETGTFVYYCSLHPSMVAQITVVS